jgi:hypothetical protein
MIRYRHSGGGPLGVKLLFSLPGPAWLKEALQTLRFCCARGVTHFSQRVQRNLPYL